MRLYLLSNSEGGAGSVADAPLLGVVSMVAGSSVSAGENGTSTESPSEAAAYLKKALDILDRSGAPTQVAARVQQALDSLEEWRSS